MNTTHVDELYTAYLDGTLPEAERQRVEAHLRDCPRCAGEVEAMRVLVTDLRAMPTPPLPADFVANVRAGVTAAPRLASWFPWRLPALAGGLVAFAVLAVLLIGQDAFQQVAKNPSGEQAPKTTEQTTNTYTEQPREPGAGSRSLAKGAPDDATALKLDAPAPGEGVAGGVTPGAKTSTMDSQPARAENTDKSGAGNAPSLGKPSNTAARPAPPPMPAESADDHRLLANANERLRVDVPALPEAAPNAVRTPTVTGMAHDPYAFAPTTPAPGMPPGEEHGPGTSKSVNGMESMRPTAPMAVGYAAADAVEAKCTQRASFGNVQVVSNVLPVNADGQVSLRVEGKTPAKLQVDYARPLLRNTPQVIATPAEVRQFDLNLPPTAQGSAVRLQWNSGKANDTYYLVVPGAAPRRAQVDLLNSKQPVVDTLLELANDLGLYIFCPAPFAEQPTRVVMQQATPMQALKMLAEQHQHTANLCDNLVNITPDAR